MRKIALISFLFLSACASSTTHVGVKWGDSTGAVSSSDASKAMKFVDEFHGYLQSEHWEAVHGALDNRLQEIVGKTEFKNSFAKIKATFGNESRFELSKYEPSALLHKMSKLGLSDAKHVNTYVYFDAVVTTYLSTRSNGNLIYIIGVSKADKNADLKVSSLQIFREHDVNFKILNSPVFSASVAYPKVVP